VYLDAVKIKNKK